MAKIIKIILDTGEEHSIEKIKPLSYFQETFPEGQWRINMRYNRQFIDFEDEILKYLDDDNLETYAIDKFTLVGEIDVEEKDISDFSDNEILEELKDRKIFVTATNIITEDFIKRFSKIIEKENALLLDNVLSEFESKLNIIP